MIVGDGSAALTAGVNSHPDKVNAAAPSRPIAISQWRIAFTLFVVANFAHTAIVNAKERAIEIHAAAFRASWFRHGG